MRIFKSISIIVPTILLLTACGSANIKSEIDAGSVKAAKTLSAAEVKKLLIGNTYPFWSKDGVKHGGMYFSSATDAVILWKGKTEETKWYATNSGKFCYTVEVFGGNEECLGLVRKPNGDYISDFNGKKRLIPAANIKKGKTI